MTEPTTTEPPKPEPHAAVIELVERHRDEKRPYVGSGSILLPNMLRIDGVAIWASADQPIVIGDITVDGSSRAPFAVEVTLQARALRVGEAATILDEPLGYRDENGGAIIEIPNVDEPLSPGDELHRPYVLVNGSPIYVAGPVKVGTLGTDGKFRGAVEVTMTLLCRKLIVDDEPELAAPAAAAAA